MKNICGVFGFLVLMMAGLAAQPGPPTEGFADLSVATSDIKGGVQFAKSNKTGVDIDARGLSGFDAKRNYTLYVVKACPAGKPGDESRTLAQTLKTGHRFVTIKSGKLPEKPITDKALSFGPEDSVVGKFVLLTEGSSIVACALIVPPRF